jgi:uncharacterized protein (DUF1697 family)
MPTWIALFRGINVGGKNILPMKDLVRELEALKAQNVKTYIHSGNAVFQRPKQEIGTLGARIGRRIENRHSFRPHVLILSAEKLKDAIAANPFPEAESEPKTLHLSFLDSKPPAPDMETLNHLKSPTERFQLVDEVFYLHAPDGIGRSKLAAGVEKCLGVSATTRNWRTVKKIAEIIGES